MNRTLLTATALFAAMTTGALADVIDRRQERQAHAIEQGRRTGELNWMEAARLRAEQNRIAAMERRAKADGHVSRYEAREIDRAQDAARRHIAQESHDSQKSWRRRWF